MSTGSGDPFPLGSLPIDAPGLLNAAKQADSQFAKLAQSIQRSMEVGAQATEKLAGALRQATGHAQGSTGAAHIASGIRAAVERLHSAHGQNTQFSNQLSQSLRQNNQALLQLTQAVNQLSKRLDPSRRQVGGASGSNEQQIRREQQWRDQQIAADQRSLAPQFAQGQIAQQRALQQMAPGGAPAPGQPAAVQFGPLRDYVDSLTNRTSGVFASARDAVLEALKTHEGRGRETALEGKARSERSEANRESPEKGGSESKSDEKQGNEASENAGEMIGALQQRLSNLGPSLQTAINQVVAVLQRRTTAARVDLPFALKAQQGVPGAEAEEKRVMEKLAPQIQKVDEARERARLQPWPGLLQGAQLIADRLRVLSGGITEAQFHQNATAGKFGDWMQAVALANEQQQKLNQMRGEQLDRANKNEDFTKKFGEKPSRQARKAIAEQRNEDLGNTRDALGNPIGLRALGEDFLKKKGNFKKNARGESDHEFQQRRRKQRRQFDVAGSVERAVQNIEKQAERAEGEQRDALLNSAKKLRDEFLDMRQAIAKGKAGMDDFRAAEKRATELMNNLSGAEKNLTNVENERANAEKGRGRRGARGQQNAFMMAGAGGAGGAWGGGGGGGGGASGNPLWDDWQKMWQAGNQALQPFMPFMPQGMQQAVNVANQWNNQMDAMMAPFNKMVGAFQQGQQWLQNAQQLQQQIANDPMLNPIGFALQGGADLWQQVNEQFKTDPKGALQTARGYIKAQIQQTLSNVSQATGDPIQYSFGSISQPGILPVNMNQALAQNPQAAATIKMFEQMLAKLDEIEKSLGPGKMPATTPHMAAGGLVTVPTVALIGEDGPEAVVPLSGFSGTPITSAINNVLQTALSGSPQPTVIPMGTLNTMFGNPANIFPGAGGNPNTFPISPGGFSINPLGLNAGNLGTFGKLFDSASSVLNQQIDLGNSGALGLLNQWQQVQQTAEDALGWMNQRRQINLGGGVSSPAGPRFGAASGADNPWAAAYNPFGGGSGIGGAGGVTFNIHGVDLGNPSQVRKMVTETLLPALNSAVRTQGFDMTGRSPLGYRPNGRSPFVPAGQAR